MDLNTLRQRIAQTALLCTNTSETNFVEDWGAGDAFMGGFVEAIWQRLHVLSLADWQTLQSRTAGVRLFSRKVFATWSNLGLTKDRRNWQVHQESKNCLTTFEESDCFYWPKLQTRACFVYSFSANGFILGIGEGSREPLSIWSCRRAQAKAGGGQSHKLWWTVGSEQRAQIVDADLDCWDSHIFLVVATWDLAFNDAKVQRIARYCKSDRLLIDCINVS